MTTIHNCGQKTFEVPSCCPGQRGKTPNMKRNQQPPAPVIHQRIEIPQQKAEDQESKPDFWDLIRKITPEQWSSTHLVYLYRENPRPNTKGPAYLAILNHEFDLEFIKQQWGGYDYKAMLIANKSMVATHYFSIDAAPKGASTDFQHQNGSPQILSPAGNDSTNLVKQMMEMLREEIRNGRVNSGNSNDPVLNGAVDMLKKLIPEQKDPLEIVGKLKELLAPGQNSVMEGLFMTMIKKLIDGPPAAAVPQPFQALQEKLMEKMLTNIDKPGGREPSLGHMLMERVPEILEGASNIMDKWLRISQENRATSDLRFASILQARAGQQISPAPAPAGQIPGSPAVVAPGYIPMPSPIPITPMPPPIEQTLNEMEKLVTIAKERIVYAISEGDDGEKIVDFLDILEPRLLESFNGASVDDIDKFFQTDPILRKAAAAPLYRQILEQMVNYLAEEETAGVA